MIELAFTEDWRSIVGELTLAYLTKGLGEIAIITANWDLDFIGTLVSLVGDKLGISWRWINLDQSDLDDPEKGKKTLRKYLKDWI